ncbi:UDP-glucosyl transferase 85A3 [Actinidia rufa]|uniref:UDP-glucosyl transferase 85A3 n=1 Tax=Actinidia rufa TaxID=165716 RepID=A0A7J0DLF7_9ERIC|nr:UDP-glucosyl transferase 85A3 [Actinidia rufa]
MTPSDTTHVTGGTSLCSSNLNGPKQFFRVESHSAGTSWVASWWSGAEVVRQVLTSKRKSGRPATEAWPWERMRRRWLKSVLTKVTWKPREWRSLESRIMGVTWPWDGVGNTNHMRFSSVR